MKKVLVTGSLAYDYIMNFPGHFGDHILPDKIHILNVSFVAKNLSREFGGTGGNIAYNLALLKEKPILAATAGYDFTEYKDILKKTGVQTDYIEVISKERTASAHIITDKTDNQINAFHPGSLEFDNWSIKNIVTKTKPDLAILAPSNVSGMVKRAKELKQQKIPYIFDPGQMVSLFSKKDILACVEGCKMIIGNDYEMEIVSRKTGLKIDDLKKKIDIIVVTLGAKGSRIYSGSKKIKIPAVKGKRILDPTGAGDAYRAGFIKGLLLDLPLEQCGKLGAQASIYTVEIYGTQTHKYTPQEFSKRYAKSFGEPLPKKVFRS